VLEQPVNLNTLTDRYATFVSDFIATRSQQPEPWFFYMAFSHVHVPDFASPEYCNRSLRGRFGDALEEMDNLTGSIIQALEAAGADENTIIFFRYMY
jgi:arylsulfatase A